MSKSSLDVLEWQSGVSGLVAKGRGEQWNEPLTTMCHWRTFMNEGAIMILFVRILVCGAIKGCSALTGCQFFLFAIGVGVCRGLLWVALSLSAMRVGVKLYPKQKVAGLVARKNESIFYYEMRK